MNNETLNAQARDSLPSPAGRRAGDEGAQRVAQILEA